MTFEEVAERCIDSKKPEWKNVKHIQQWSNSLKAYAYPVFGKLSISDFRLFVDNSGLNINTTSNLFIKLHGYSYILK